MQISEEQGEAKLAHWHEQSTSLVAQITIEGKVTGSMAVSIVGVTGELLILRLAGGQLMISLLGSRFADESIENDSLTIYFDDGGSCSLEDREPIDEDWS